MKTYQSGTKEKRKNFFKRHKHVVIIVASMLVIGAVLAVTLSLTLPKRNAGVSPEPNIPVDVDPVVQIVLPMKDATVGMGYNDNKLVYWETLESWRTHSAVDFVGAGDVFSVMDGKISAVESTSLEGTVITVTHDNGYVSIYKSLADEAAVKVGDSVKAGDKLGTTDSTMLEQHLGEHLHFELKQNGEHVDPSTVLPMTTDK